MLIGRKFKKILIILCAFVLAVSAMCGSALAAEPIEYSSQSVIVTEVGSGATLINENPDLPLKPGSLTKIVAVYVVASECFSGRVSLDDVIVITEEMKSSDNGAIPLKIDEEFTLEQLIYLMYMDYSNTAANAIVAHTAGSTEEFVEKMNAVMTNAGCTNTVFKNVLGDYDEEQVTTAADMVKFLQMAVKNTVFYDIFTATSYSVPETNKSIGRSVGTQNLLQRPGSDYHAKNCKGGRNGGFKDPGYSVVSISESSDTGMRLIVVTGANPNWNDAYNDAYNLIEWTFSNFSWQSAVKVGDAIARIPVALAEGSDYVVVGPEKDINVLLDNSISVTEFEHNVIVYPSKTEEELTAPIQKGEVLGELVILNDGVELGRVKLIATKDINLAKGAFLKNELKDTFKSSGVVWCVVGLVAVLVLYLAYTIFFWIRKYNKSQKIKEIHRRIVERRKRGVRPHMPEGAVIAETVPEENKEEIPEIEEVTEISEEVPVVNDLEDTEQEAIGEAEEQKQTDGELEVAEIVTAEEAVEEPEEESTDIIDDEADTDGGEVEAAIESEISELSETTNEECEEITESEDEETEDGLSVADKFKKVFNTAKNKIINVFGAVKNGVKNLFCAVKAKFKKK